MRSVLRLSIASHELIHVRNSLLCLFVGMVPTAGDLVCRFFSPSRYVEADD